MDRVFLSYNQKEVIFMKRFNSKLFLVVTVLFAAVAFVSFTEAFARDEGKIGHSGMRNFLANLFNVVRFPTHYFLKGLTRNPLYFSLGLIVNCMLYSLLVERAIYFISKPRGGRNDPD